MCFKSHSLKKKQICSHRCLFFFSFSHADIVLIKHGYHVPEGTLAFVDVTQEQCVNYCASTPDCLAFDYNIVRFECWFHGHGTYCNRAAAKIGVIHAKRVPCTAGTETSLSLCWCSTCHWNISFSIRQKILVQHGLNGNDLTTMANLCFVLGSLLRQQRLPADIRRRESGRWATPVWELWPDRMCAAVQRLRWWQLQSSWLRQEWEQVLQVCAHLVGLQTWAEEQSASIPDCKCRFRHNSTTACQTPRVYAGVNHYTKNRCGERFFSNQRFLVGHLLRQRGAQNSASHQRRPLWPSKESPGAHKRPVPESKRPIDLCRFCFANHNSDPVFALSWDFFLLQVCRVLHSNTWNKS